MKLLTDVKARVSVAVLSGSSSDGMQGLKGCFEDDGLNKKKRIKTHTFGQLLIK